MKKLKFIIAGIAIIVSTATAQAQNYSTGFGIRLGYGNGLTLKHFLASNNAAEFILSASPRHFQLTGLYEFQQPIPGAPNLDWYIGIGAHIGNVYSKKYEGDNRFLLGADLIGGLEYTFTQAPFTVSLDWKPSFNFTNDYNEHWYAPLALSLRYTFR